MTMSSSTKIALTSAVAGILLFGGHAALQLRQEDRDLREAFANETALLGRSLKVALENALRDRQLEDIQETLTELEQIDPSLDVFVFDARANLRAESAESDPGALLSMPLLATAGVTPCVQWNETLPEGRLFMAWLLERDGGDTDGTLIIARPLTRLLTDLSATKKSAMITMASFLVVTILLGVFLGHVYVQRPLSRVVRAMATLRSRGTSELLPAPANEIGAVASEFNALVQALREANEHLALETDARLHLQQGLRRVDKLATLGQVSAGLAHEIGSPLQILGGRARSLLSAAHDPDRVRKNAQILVAQADRITRVVEQLLAFARRRPAALTEVEIIKATGAVVDLLGLEARRRQVHLELTTEPELPPVLADADQVQQVVLNLVSNALAATPVDGRVSVHLSRSSLSEGRAAVQISVSDTGGGMSEETQSKLFQPFFTTRPSEGGTGLGLAVVRSIVTEHGGAIEVESQPGQGSRFVIDLPIDGPVGLQVMAS